VKATPAIIQHEFIGLKAKVVKSSNPDCLGIMGKVVDETRNTIVISQDGKRKTVVKDQSVFYFTLPDGTVVEVAGTILVGRPEERLKKRIRRLW
jgi:ribonuclease P protein subunit POP4